MISGFTLGLAAIAGVWMFLVTTLSSEKDIKQPAKPQKPSSDSEEPPS